jgi:hypothetical protein
LLGEMEKMDFCVNLQYKIDTRPLTKTAEYKIEYWRLEAVIVAGLAVAAFAVWFMSKNGKACERNVGEKSVLLPGSMGFPFIGETLEYLCSEDIIVKQKIVTIVFTGIRTFTRSQIVLSKLCPMNSLGEEVKQ